MKSIYLYKKDMYFIILFLEQNASQIFAFFSINDCKKKFDTNKIMIVEILTHNLTSMEHGTLVHFSFH